MLFTSPSAPVSTCQGGSFDGSVTGLGNITFESGSYDFGVSSSVAVDVAVSSGATVDGSSVTTGSLLWFGKVLVWWVRL